MIIKDLKLNKTNKPYDVYNARGGLNLDDVLALLASKYYELSGITKANKRSIYTNSAEGYIVTFIRYPAIVEKYFIGTFDAQEKLKLDEVVALIKNAINTSNTHEIALYSNSKIYKIKLYKRR